MCETAYDMILVFPEYILSQLHCDLKSRRIFSRKKLIFSNGVFHDCGGANILNSVPLIKNTALPEAKWIHEIRDLHSKFYTCYPRPLRSWINFYPAKLNPEQPIASLDFHRCRLSLELYIMFHSEYGNFSWENDLHFMRVVAPDCVIYRSWLLKEVQHVQVT